jgi:hypothetical protein
MSEMLASKGDAATLDCNKIDVARAQHVVQTHRHVVRKQRRQVRFGDRDGDSARLARSGD